MRPRHLLLLASIYSIASYADVVTLVASKDASIFQNNPDYSNGGGPGIFSGTSGTGSPRRALIAFDMTSIPAGAIITSVQLTLTLGLVANGGPPSATIGLYALTQSWGQGTTGGTATAINGTGQGYPANPGDATWNSAHYSATTPTQWATPGGDHASTASATLFLNNNTAGSSFTWLSTPQLVANAQGWLNNPATNFGLELINADEVSSSTLFAFYSSEWDNTQNGGSASQVPQLQVTYTVPEPGAAALACAGALGCLARRHRVVRKRKRSNNDSIG